MILELLENHFDDLTEFLFFTLRQTEFLVRGHLIRRANQIEARVAERLGREMCYTRLNQFQARRAQFGARLIIQSDDSFAGRQ